MQKLFKAGFIVPILSLLLLANAPARADAFASTINSFRNAGESGRFFDTAYGYAVFGQLPDGISFVGMAVIVASGVGLAVHERRRHAHL